MIPEFDEHLTELQEQERKLLEELQRELHGDKFVLLELELEDLFREAFRNPD
jgi:hypothetical protein